MSEQKENNIVLIGTSNITKEGLVLHTNKPAILKDSPHFGADEYYVSWDLIGERLFENYSEAPSKQRKSFNHNR